MQRQTIKLMQIRTGILALIVLSLLGCGKSDPLISRAEEFFKLRDDGNLVEARKIIAPDARQWFETRTGDGQPWNLDGPWMAWDSVFNATREYRDWKSTDSSVSVTAIEDNDFYRMIERDPQPVELTLYFNESGKINGYLVHSEANSPPKDDFSEFTAWAAKHYPQESMYLMPGGKLSPRNDRPMRLRRLLYEWRNATGRSEID